MGLLQTQKQFCALYYSKGNKKGPIVDFRRILGWQRARLRARGVISLSIFGFEL